MGKQLSSNRKDLSGKAEPEITQQIKPHGKGISQQKCSEKKGDAELSIGRYHMVLSTHTGYLQDVNEDRAMANPLKDGSLLLAVADGLGGNVGGDIAAEMIREELSQITGLKMGCETDHLMTIALGLDEKINAFQKTDSRHAGVGSTLTSALIRHNTLFWVHVGDTRLYYLRDRQLYPVTQDQTLARFLIKEGDISEDEALSHYSRHVMDQFLGCGYAEPETGCFEICAGDLFMLSTDGLHKQVHESEITDVLNASGTLMEKAAALIAAANDAGGKDNASVILLDVSTA